MLRVGKELHLTKFWIFVDEYEGEKQILVLEKVVRDSEKVGCIDGSFSESNECWSTYMKEVKLETQEVVVGVWLKLLEFKLWNRCTDW